MTPLTWYESSLISSITDRVTEDVPIIIISLDTPKSFDDFHPSTYSSKYCVLSWKLQMSDKALSADDNFQVQHILTGQRLTRRGKRTTDNSFT